MGEAMHVWRHRDLYGKSLYLPLDFVVNLKLAQKDPRSLSKRQRMRNADQ